MPLAFILGREPQLSVAELFAVLGDAVVWENAEMSREAMVAPFSGDGMASVSLPSRWEGRLGGVGRADSTHDSPTPSISPSQREGEDQFLRALMARLAGTVKIAEVLDVVPHASSSLTDAIGHLILDHTNVEKRVRFGYSVYDLGGGAKEVQRVRAALTRGAKAQKAWLEEHGRKVRHVTSRDAQLSSVTVERQGLLPEDNGVEVVVLVGRASHTASTSSAGVAKSMDGRTSDLQHPSQGEVVIIFARTLAVQQFREWSKRDYGRPRRDARSGMLPPKLARMMVNIALQSKIGNQQSKILLDPFCGSGTVLTEAMALGVPHIIGTDISEDAVRDARENVEWVRRATRESQISNLKSHITITECDVRHLSRCVQGKIDVIVTEPYLGPPDVGAGTRPRPSGGRPRGVAPTQSAIDDVVRELRALYVTAFREFATVLSPGGRVVFVVPDYRLRTTDYRQPSSLDISLDVAPLGFTRVNPFPPVLRDHPVLRNREDLPYARADQRVGRRILLFTYQPQH